MEIVDKTEELDLGWLKRYAKLLDSSIPIPSTSKSIGIDPLLGLFPAVGPIAGYLFSILLIFQTLKSRPSPMLLSKMFVNVTLDVLVGSVPVLGTLFDFIYKANERNYRLLVEFKTTDAHRESVLPYFIGFMVISLLIVCLIAYLTLKLILAIWQVF